MKNFLSCDWGTTSFRLRFVNIATLQSTYIEVKETGIAKVFELWKKSGTGEKGRITFFLQVISDHIKDLEQQTGQTIENSPLVISGMASSSLGIMEMAYKQLPAYADGRDLIIKKIEGIKDFSNNIFLVSGIRSEDDAMRGEETQLAGCDLNPGEERIFIFPGTHSKHVTVRSGQVIDIKTYMTGEFFSLLSQQSILTTSVKKGDGLNDKQNKKAFEIGIQAGVQSNLLHSSFLVRTNQLFNKLTVQANYYYLSGLLIGSELREITPNKNIPITLVVSGEMKEFYQNAFSILGLKKGIDNFRIENSDMALIKGQLRILKHEY